MRPEYSTKRGRRQEAPWGQGLSIGGFLPWDYQIRFGFRGCQGADAPSPYAGGFGKGKRAVEGKSDKRKVGHGGRRGREKKKRKKRDKAGNG